MGDGLEDVKRVSSVEKNIVVAPAALEAAKYLERTYGTPYETGYPLVDELVCDMDYHGKKVLIVQQQVIGCAIREEILKKAPDAQVTVASWFMMKPELRRDEDLNLRDEEDYIGLVENGAYDVIYADSCMKRMTPKFEGVFVDTIHFAVSGKLVTVEAAKKLKEPKNPRGSKEPGKTDSHDYYNYDRMSLMGEVYE